MPRLGYRRAGAAVYDNDSCFLLPETDIRQYSGLGAKHASGRARKDAAQLFGEAIDERQAEHKSVVP